ncbi:hypothetical protein AAFF_G00424970 [Aldrovandia affinis]|uniref:phospholipase A2 n=1 Tax=Aldrovandia affinis TaxID=143900 RepID=A0AAD7T747_9TELE|nr:hypothetical protein AAFF_G00424970 [Aldrovandia affinis]
MRRRRELHLLVFLVLYNLSTAYVVTVSSKADPGNANFCYWMNSTTQGRIHYSFLRESAGIQPNALRLYLSTWTENQRLVDCMVFDEPAVTESYLSLCREQRVGDFSGSLGERFNVSLLLAPGNPCVIHSAMRFEPPDRVKRDLQMSDPTHFSHHNPDVSGRPEVRRLKRSWVFPGTLWCGMGTKANDYEDIGMFGKTDSCCREHDHCRNIIPAFKVNYGVFNHNFFTVSHCDCDHRFRQCLQGVNDTVSHMVGYSFFNVLKVPCFEFIQKKHCTELSWWGLCKSVQVAPYAQFQNPALYRSTNPAQVDEESGVPAVPSTPAANQTITVATSRPAATAFRNGAVPAARACRPHARRPDRRCGPMDPPRGDTFQPNRKRGGRPGAGKRRKANVEEATTSPPPRTSTTTTGAPARKTVPLSTARRRASGSLGAREKGLGSENTLPTDLPWSQDGHAPNNLPAPVQNTQHKDKLQLCDCYKRLDECRYKILPQGEKYGLRNLESKILYHCNCTRRLALQLRRLTEASVVQSLLLDFVSLSCFRVPPLQECPQRGRRCPAVLSESRHLKQTLKRMEVTEVRDVGSTPKVKRQNRKKAMGKSPPIRLYHKCIRITGKNRQAQPS